MSQGTLAFTGGHAFELTRVNRALARLERPGSREEWLSPLSPADLVILGVFTEEGCHSGTSSSNAYGGASASFCARPQSTTGWGPLFPVA
jgi:hypothetical protein